MNNSYKKAMDKIELSDELKEKIINNTSKPQKNKIYKFRPVSVRRIAGLAACFVFCFLSYYAVTNYYIQPDANIVSVDTPKPISNNEDLSEKMATNEPVQEHLSSKVISDTKTDDVINNSTELTNPSTDKKVKADDNQIEVILPKQEAVTKNNSSTIDNSLPPFAKGKVAAENNNDNTVIQKLTVEEVSAVFGYEIKYPQNAPTGYNISNISIVDESIAEITYQGEDDKITYRTAKSSEDLSQTNNTYEFIDVVNVNNTDIVLKGSKELYYNAVWSDNAESFSIISDNGIEKDFMLEMVSSIDYTAQTDTEN